MSGPVREVIPNVDAGTVLAGAQFIDAFRVDIGTAAVNAREACTRMVQNGPRWIDAGALAQHSRDAVRAEEIG